ncbi:hypothetical protein VTN49DRAFT_298 [Thermomyces lanuginosus]|uniref:uncharacterized protein n=1 Tax=Thermomyces lanuginosus TaxID=5541 RepID=UPI003743A133
MPLTLPSQAQQGFANAASYDKHRPTYSDEETDILLSGAKLKGRHGATVVDLAAGTGLFTEALARQQEEFNIIAVEPHDDMRRELEKKKLPRVEVRKGWANQIPVDQGSADAVFVAQTHMFSNLEALTEIHRVLKPGGYLGMIWHVEDYNATRDETPSSHWELVVKDIIWNELDDSLPRFRHNVWRQVFTETGQTLFKAPVQETSVDDNYYASRQQIWERLRTLSQFSILEGEKLIDVKSRIDEALAREDVEVDEKGNVLVRSKTHAAWTRRKP